MAPVGLLLLLSAPVLGLYEVGYWLVKGNWHGINLVSLLTIANADHVITWLYLPQTLIGLSKLCRYLFELPLAYFCFLSGALVCWIGSKMADR
jgi:hypothetical protein